MSRYISFTTTIEVPCPVCRDGEVDVRVTLEPPDPACGYGTGAYAEGPVECTDGCPLTEEQVNEVFARAESRALEERES